MPKEVVKALELLVRAQKEQFEENLEEICKVNDALEEAKIKFAVLKGAFLDAKCMRKEQEDQMISTCLYTKMTLEN